MVLVIPAFTVPARNGGLPSSAVGEVRPRASGSTIKKERWRGSVCVCGGGGGGVRGGGGTFSAYACSRMSVCLFYFWC